MVVEGDLWRGVYDKVEGCFSRYLKIDALAPPYSNAHRRGLCLLLFAVVNIWAVHVACGRHYKRRGVRVCGAWWGIRTTPPPR